MPPRKRVNSTDAASAPTAPSTKKSKPGPKERAAMKAAAGVVVAPTRTSSRHKTDIQNTPPPSTASALSNMSATLPGRRQPRCRRGCIDSTTGQPPLMAGHRCDAGEKVQEQQSSLQNESAIAARALIESLKAKHRGTNTDTPDDDNDNDDEPDTLDDGPADDSDVIMPTPPAGDDVPPRSPQADAVLPEEPTADDDDTVPITGATVTPEEPPKEPAAPLQPSSPSSGSTAGGSNGSAVPRSSVGGPNGSSAPAIRPKHKSKSKPKKSAVPGDGDDNSRAAALESAKESSAQAIGEGRKGERQEYYVKFMPNAGTDELVPQPLVARRRRKQEPEMTGPDAQGNRGTSVFATACNAGQSVVDRLPGFYLTLYRPFAGFGHIHTFWSGSVQEHLEGSDNKFWLPIKDADTGKDEPNVREEAVPKVVEEIVGLFRDATAPHIKTLRRDEAATWKKSQELIDAQRKENEEQREVITAREQELEAIRKRNEDLMRQLELARAGVRPQ
ncbi:hypothetical protein EXIGLDRAFT_775576 [Exidia glandulosa HHB12029]|uniref:Uncharacterized protein n=1 Tax=Exidia glandulosa HHB12029 TaxID=1314781 RepID=A0A165DUZ6_EXIGL|nr:hypothetical protein EXIGLDRAFT_775576 [Exidia glandulosa HHB12029]